MAKKQPQSRFTVGQKIGDAFLIPDIALQMNLNSTIKKKKLQDLPESFAEFMRAFPRGGKVYPNSFEAINSKGECRRFSIELISAACFYERGLKHDRSIVIPESYVQFANLDNFFPLYVSCERQPGSIWALALSPTSLWGKENVPNKEDKLMQVADSIAQLFERLVVHPRSQPLEWFEPVCHEDLERLGNWLDRLDAKGRRNLTGDNPNKIYPVVTAICMGKTQAVGEFLKRGVSAQKIGLVSLAPDMYLDLLKQELISPKDMDAALTSFWTYEHPKIVQALIAAGANVASSEVLRCCQDAENKRSVKLVRDAREAAGKRKAVTKKPTKPKKGVSAKKKTKRPKRKESPPKVSTKDLYESCAAVRDEGKVWEDWPEYRAETPAGLSVLWYAVRGQQKNAVEMLLAYKAPVDLPLLGRVSLLDLAKRNKKIVQMLKDAGAKPKPEKQLAEEQAAGHPEWPTMLFLTEKDLPFYQACMKGDQKTIEKYRKGTGPGKLQRLFYEAAIEGYPEVLMAIMPSIKNVMRIGSLMEGDYVFEDAKRFKQFECCRAILAEHQLRGNNIKDELQSLPKAWRERLQDSLDREKAKPSKAKGAKKDAPATEFQPGEVVLEGNYSITLVKGKASTVAKKLAKIEPTFSNPQEFTVPVSGSGAMVFNVVGMKWSVIVVDHQAKLNRAASMIAAELSNGKRGEAVEIVVGDSAGAYGYEYFRDGQSCERYFSMEAAEFESTLREIDEDALDLENPAEVMFEFLLLRKAFAPPWSHAYLASKRPPGCTEAWHLPILSTKL